MATPGRGLRAQVRIAAAVWREEVERFDERSRARTAAERERGRLEGGGIELTQLKACSAQGADGSRLTGLLKVYVPIGDSPPSERRFGFVLGPGRDERGRYLALIAYGERHPKSGVRSVYERAHRRLHGRYPDQ